MLVAILLYLTDGVGRDTGDHRTVRHVVCDDRACPNDTVTADGDPWHDHGVHTDVAVVADGDAAEAVAVRKVRALVAQHPTAAVVGVKCKKELSWVNKLCTEVGAKLRNFLRCGCWRGLTLVCALAAYEKSLRFPEGLAFTVVETRGIEPLTS